MSSNFQPWYAIAKPHEDIREGRLSEDVFAANVWAVHQNEAAVSDLYRDPGTFFEKTFLTGGLTNVLRKVSRALAGDADAGDRILSLQTSFGGGKTHSLVALWHLAKHTEVLRRSAACAELREALGGDLPKAVKSVAVFTNHTCDATQGRLTPEGIHTHTLWGELALQLGGPELYRKVEANDTARTVPQGLFAEILRQAAPCLILLDEVADYCVGASAVEMGTTTLADQTISFVQQLTEAVQQVKGVALVATLPASHLEVASSEKGQEILDRLEKRFGRMSADIKPVGDNEIYEVVRRRLFETIGTPAQQEKVAAAYRSMYATHAAELPPDATRANYKERILAAYPFHPTLIDALYLRWGSHADFQRTRGVLQLLASVVGDLWKRRNTETQSQPLIQPCHVNWNLDSLHAALTRLWGTAYESVVAADVTGDKANAFLLDEERGSDYRTEKITQGLASSILMGSFGGQGERSGFSGKELKLCLARPGLNWGYIEGALLAFEERGFYLHPTAAGSLGKRYWFDTKPTLTNLIVQYRSQFQGQTFEGEMIEALQQEAKNPRPGEATWRVIVNPDAELPEQKTLALLVLPPEYSYSENGGGPADIVSITQKFVAEISETCGKKNRDYRNTLLFLLPSQRGLSQLRNALREVAALEAVQRDYGSQLETDQRDDLNKRLVSERNKVVQALAGAYVHIARIEGQQFSVVALTDVKATFSEHLQAAWKQLVEDEEWILRKVGPVTLQKVGLVPDEGGTRVKDAIEYFLRYTDKPMVATRDAVLQGLAQACREKLIGLGRGVTLSNLQRTWCGEDVTLDPNEDGLWIIPRFEPKVEPAPDAGTGEVSGQGMASTQATATPVTDPSDCTIMPSATDTSRFIKRLTINGAVPVENWSDVFRSFINPVARKNLKQLHLGISFVLEAPDDQPFDENDPTVKAMQESARQLGLDVKTE